MANSGPENFESGRNFSPRTINEHDAIAKGRSRTAGVFFWKRNLHGKLSKKSECAQKNENFEHENTAKRKRENVSTGRMMFDLLGNIRKHLGIEKLSTRKSRQKVHDVQRLRVESNNETQSDGKERLALDGIEAIRTADSARSASETADSQEESCSDQQLDCAEELSNRTERELARDLAAADGGDNCSERDYVASNESKAKANLTEELLKLSRYGWYWGPISGDEADAKLISEPDGAFLVRDSSDDRYLLTLSFKSSGKLLHARMEHSGGLFSLCNHGESEGFTSVAELIDHSMNFSQSAVFCYSRPKYPGYPSFPVRLTKPVSRFTRVRSLQYLCRFVIRQNTRLDNIRKLPLPTTIRGYIEEAHF